MLSARTSGRSGEIDVQLDRFIFHQPNAVDMALLIRSARFTSEKDSSILPASIFGKVENVVDQAQQVLAGVVNGAEILLLEYH